VPSPSSLDLFAFAVAAVTFVALWRFRPGILWVVAGSAVVGAIRVAL